MDWVERIEMIQKKKKKKKNGWIIMRRHARSARRCLCDTFFLTMWRGRATPATLSTLAARTASETQETRNFVHVHATGALLSSTRCHCCAQELLQTAKAAATLRRFLAKTRTAPPLPPPPPPPLAPLPCAPPPLLVPAAAFVLRGLYCHQHCVKSELERY